MWQPMETAPKDGTKILVQMKQNHDLGPPIVYWGYDKWLVDWDGADICKEWNDEPQFWHPLPAPATIQN